METMSTMSLLLVFAGIVVGLLLIASAFASRSSSKWWKIWAGRDRTRVVDGAALDASEAKSDLERGSREAGRFRRQDGDDDASSDGGGDGGGD